MYGLEGFNHAGWQTLSKCFDSVVVLSISVQSASLFEANKEESKDVVPTAGGWLTPVGVKGFLGSGTNE